MQGEKGNLVIVFGQPGLGYCFIHEVLGLCFGSGSGIGPGLGWPSKIFRVSAWLYVSVWPRARSALSGVVGAV